MHGYLLPNNSVAMYKLGLNVELLLKLNAYFTQKTSYEKVWLGMVGVAIRISIRTNIVSLSHASKS